MPDPMNIQLNIQLPDETVAFYRAELPEGGDLNAYLSQLAAELLQSLCECEQKGGPSPDRTAGAAAASGQGSVPEQG